jgi:phenylalanyl-tRNA synthetase beta chain
MRPTLLVSGLEVIAYNHNRRNADLKLFEFGRSYHTKENGFEETEHLAIYVTGNLTTENWKSKQTLSDIYFLKGIVFNVLKQCGIEKFEVTEATNSELNYGLQISAEKKVLATLGSVSSAILKKFDIEGEVFYADILWENLLACLNNKTLKFREISKYPWVRRDLALLLDKTVKFEQVEKIAQREINKVLKSVNLFDIYEDKKLGDNKKSYAISFVFEDAEKTLKDEEVDKWMTKLIAQYKSELGAEIR